MVVDFVKGTYISSFFKKLVIKLGKVSNGLSPSSLSGRSSPVETSKAMLFPPWSYSKMPFRFSCSSKTALIKMTLQQAWMLLVSKSSFSTGMPQEPAPGHADTCAVRQSGHSSPESLQCLSSPRQWCRWSRLPFYLKSPHWERLPWHLIAESASRLLISLPPLLGFRFLFHST